MSNAITDEMIEAGVTVLWQSGAIEYPIGSDRLLVADIFEAMIRVSDISKNVCEGSQVHAVNTDALARR
jgi:hypothetical protein